MPTNNSWNSQNPAQVALGGTGVASTTAYAVLCGGTTSTGALQSIVSVGTSGKVLTSNGAGALPTFQAVPGAITTIAGTTGSTTGPTVTIAGQDGLTTSVSGTTLTVTTRGPSSDTMFLGQGTGNASFAGSNSVALGAGAYTGSTGGGDNVAVGVNSLASATALSNCTAVGYLAMQTTGNYNGNTAIGSNAMQASGGPDNTAIGCNALATGAGTTGNNVAVGFNSMITASAGYSTAVGYGSLANATGNNICAYGYQALGLNTLTGSDNIAVGTLAGTGFTGSESNNIVIGNSLGTVGDNNTLRIGNQGSGTNQQNLCFIAGITGATVTGSAVLCSTSGQLGTIASSVRYKENIKDLTSQADKLTKLRPVSFNFKKDNSKTSQMGLIAEEVHKNFPYLCLYNDEGEPESVKYHELPIILLQEVQRLNKKITELETKLSKSVSL